MVDDDSKRSTSKREFAIDGNNVQIDYFAFSSSSSSSSFSWENKSQTVRNGKWKVIEGVIAMDDILVRQIGNSIETTTPIVVVVVGVIVAVVVLGGLVLGLAIYFVQFKKRQAGVGEIIGGDYDAGEGL